LPRGDHWSSFTHDLLGSIPTRRASEGSEPRPQLIKRNPRWRVGLVLIKRNPRWRVGLVLIKRNPRWPDSQLLKRFIATSGDADRTAAELAFGSLVERQGRMVGTCAGHNLVDPVPILVAGVWKGLDVERLVAHLRDGKLVDPLREIDQPKKIDRARPPVLMLRAFDFAVEADKTYRYRTRLAFWAPVEIRRKTRRDEIQGPWSEPTAPVEVRSTE
jgi:hypothetical protein